MMPPLIWNSLDCKRKKVTKWKSKSKKESSRLDCLLDTSSLAASPSLNQQLRREAREGSKWANIRDNLIVPVASALINSTDPMNHQGNMQTFGVGADPRPPNPLH